MDSTLYFKFHTDLQQWDLEYMEHILGNIIGTLDLTTQHILNFYWGTMQFPSTCLDGVEAILVDNFQDMDILMDLSMYIPRVECLLMVLSMHSSRMEYLTPTLYTKISIILV